MKVTVSFGDTKVVVPCGEGNMPVRDLVDKAMHRYRKSATAAVAAGIMTGGENSPELPSIDYVKLARDNGILDWDDRVCDVLDDREMIVACLAPADLPSGPLPSNALTDQRVPPLHGTAGGGDSLGSASSPEFHTAPASSASAITHRVRQGEGSGGGDGATGSLTTLGDTCSPGGSTSGASSSAPGHEPPGGQGGGGKPGSGLQHHLGCPAATGGSEPALAPHRGPSRVGSSILVSGNNAINVGSPPTGPRTANNGMSSHRHQPHRGSLDSCANPPPGQPGQCVEDGRGTKGRPQIANSGEHLHHQHPFLSNQPVHETHHFLAPKKHPDPIDISPSTNTTSRSPAMVAIDSNSSSDHDEDYPRLRREPIGRQSLGNNPSLLLWLDAQERLQHGTPDTEPATKPLVLRIDPRNDSNSVEPPPGSSLLKTAGPRSAKEIEALGLSNASNSTAVYQNPIMVKLRNQDNEKGGGLGIQVKPYYSPSPGPGLGNRVEAGLEIQRVVPGGRMAREGKLRAGDRIIEINKKSLSSVSFVRAQEMFRMAMRTPEIQLLVIPAEPVQSPPGDTTKGPPPPILPKPNVSSPPPPPPPPPNNLSKRPAPLPPPENEDDEDEEEEDPWLEDEATFPAINQRSQQQQQLQQQLAQAAVSIANAKKAPPPPQRSPMTHLSGIAGSRNGSGDRRETKEDEDNSSRPTEDSHAISSSSPSSAGKSSGHQRSSSLGGSKKDLVNTKRPGVRHSIVLAKGKDGFGFSLTTRDTKTNGPNPILVKSILSRGSAIRDGRLRCGDRMLEVDGLDVTERTQKEVVQMLKSIAVGKNVKLTISRQEENDEEGVNGEQDDSRRNNNLSAESNRAKYRTVPMEFDISLEDTELNGLGISVKGLSRESPGRMDEKDVAEGRDEGVYVKNVITGGAAAKDGRLEVNDQILEINGTSLRGLSNKQALARLRSAVQRGSKDSVSGVIRVVIARRQPIASSMNSGDSSNHSMLISAEVHEQQSQARSSKPRLPRQPTRQQRIEDEDDPAVEDEDDTPPLPPPPPMEEFESVSGCGTLEHHPEVNHIARPQPNPSSTASATCRIVPLLDLTSSGQRHHPTPPASPRPSNPLSPRQRRQTSKTSPNPPNDVTEEKQHRRSNSAELIGQATAYSSEDEEPFDGPPTLSREGLGRRSMSEKRHAMEAAQQYSFYQDLAAKKQAKSQDGQEDVDGWRSGLHTLPSASRMRAMQKARQEEGLRARSDQKSSDRPPLASSQQLLQRCQRLLAQRHPSTDSLSSTPLRASLPATTVAASHKRPSRPPPPIPSKKVEENNINSTSSLRNGPIKAVEPMQLENESTFSMDSASLLSTASTTALHNNHPRHRRTRPISFRRAVDPSLQEPDDQPNSTVTLRPSRGRNREDSEAKTSSGFWKSLWQRRKSRNLPQRPPLSDADQRVLAWQRRNDLEGNWARESFQFGDGEETR